MVGKSNRTRDHKRRSLLACASRPRIRAVHGVPAFAGPDAGMEVMGDESGGVKTLGPQLSENGKDFVDHRSRGRGSLRREWLARVCRVRARHAPALLCLFWKVIR